MDKNTKILIPEISGDWTERLRSGSTNIWNHALHGRPHRNGLPEVRLDPPEIGLYAELIDGAWYWVSGCAKCNESGERWSYSVCDKHNVCRLCGTHRSKLTKTPWGHPDGFTCAPCKSSEDAAAKAEALAKFAESEYDEHDFCELSECKCPHCATVIHVEIEDLSQSEHGVRHLRRFIRTANRIRTEFYDQGYWRARYRLTGECHELIYRVWNDPRRCACEHS